LSHSIANFPWIAVGLSQLLGRPHDVAAFARQHPPPHDLRAIEVLCEGLELEIERLPAAKRRKALGTRVGLVLALEETSATPNGDEAQHSSAATLQPVLIQLVAKGRAISFRPGVAQPRIEAQSEIAFDRYADLILLSPKPQALHSDSPYADVAAPAHSSRPFGFVSLLPEVLRHKRIWRDVLIASALVQVLGLGTPLLTQVVIDKVLVHQTMSTLIVVATAMAVFILFGTTMSWARQYLVLHTGSRIDAVLGDRVFGHLLRLPPRYFEQRPTGTVIARLQGVESVREFLTGAGVALILDLPFLLIFVAIMFAYSWELALVALGFTSVIAGLSLAITPTLRKRLDEQFLRGARSQAFTTEYVSGFETVKSLQLEPQLRRRYGDLLADYLRATFRTRQLGNSFQSLATALEQGMTLALLIVGALIVMRMDGFTIGMLVAFQMFASRMSQPMMRIVGLWQEFQQASIAVKRLGDLMDAPSEPYSAQPTRAMPQGPAGIELQDLAFRYSEHHPWLYRGLNLTLPAGRITLLTGPSGSGKSTLAKLLLGYRRPNEGRITIDGHDLAFLSANELRANFGVVPQETVLFSGSIYENLTLAKPDASFDEIVACCRMAEVHEAIEQLPQGYQTVVGEHGVGLSGGQRQRIAISRALLRQPRVLIFDEATSNLDPTTAEAFARTVNQLRGKATILFIAHHVPKGLQVDRIARFGGADAVAPRSEPLSKGDAK
jgi:subfamily B ATP-binding cassette protein HlyB/CyaB